MLRGRTSGGGLREPAGWPSAAAWLLPLFLVLASLPAVAEDPLWRELPWQQRMGVSWYEARAERGDVEAMYRLGALYERGIRARPDVDRAVRWYREAAARDHPGAQFRLGTIYQSGKAGRVDLYEASLWYRAAAQQGMARAKHNLAALLVRGAGPVEADPQQAAALFREALAGGVEAAAMSLGLLYAEGRGVPRDEVEALAWLTRAARARVPGAEQARERLAGELDEAKRMAAERRAEQLAGE